MSHIVDIGENRVKSPDMIQNEPSHITERIFE